MRIMTIDLGTKTGWATVDETGQITSGMQDFKNDRFSGGGMRYLKFKKWLTEMKSALGRIDQIAFEEVRARQPSVAADHTYGAFMGSLTSWCEHHDIPYEGVPVGTIKKYITGKGNANKQMVIEAVVEKGFDIKDDNEADAIALMLYTLKQ